MSYKIFEAYGIEAEYMVVDRDTLAITHLVEDILKAQNNGILADEVIDGEVAWSNELVDHVIEIKCNGPKSDLGLTRKNFHQSLLKINRYLKGQNACLLPTAMHPFMQPLKETKLWPHGSGEIYSAYDRIFSCQGHGWSNLQSVHINFPWDNEEEFKRLHAAIRVVLPIIPAIAASSPIFGEQFGPVPDNRLSFYHQNQAKIPSIAGKIIPEAIFTLKGYQEMLAGIYRDIAPFDPEGILQHPWLNSRGAIVKFDLKAIEIRLVDIQECPLMDFTIASLVIELVKLMANEKWVPLDTLMEQKTENLAKIYHAQNNWNSPKINDSDYLALFSLQATEMDTAELWRHLLSEITPALHPEFAVAAEIILNKGNLSQRIKSSLPQKPSREQIHKLYQKLCEHLENDTPFLS
jgi:gamma-glutamyl:cysteine ligase YbdK (ATP-grasp superfamily)